MIEELKFFFNCFLAFGWFLMLISFLLNFFSSTSLGFAEGLLVFVIMGLVFIMFVVFLTNAVVILIEKGGNW